MGSTSLRLSSDHQLADGARRRRAGGDIQAAGLAVLAAALRGEPFPVVYDEDGHPRVVPADQTSRGAAGPARFPVAALDPDDETSEPMPPLARAGLGRS